MSDYLLTIAEPTVRLGAADRAEQLAAHVRFAAELGPALIDAGLFHPSHEARRVHARGTDLGPFEGAAARYYLVRADDLETAIQIANRCPLGDAELLDVRPLMKGRFPPGKLDQPGKVFAFLVLGAAPDEPAWDAIMDRIDEQTQSLGIEVFGGLRLLSPRTGRRLAVDKSKRRLLDGPFLESKEVIGGLFVATMASIEDAVHWARSSAFPHHGTLEIRELWRT